MKRLPPNLAPPNPLRQEGLSQSGVTPGQLPLMGIKGADQRWWLGAALDVEGMAHLLLMLAIWSVYCDD